MNDHLLKVLKKLYLISITLSSYFILQYIHICVYACGQSPDPSAYHATSHSHLKGALQLDQAPIKPIFVERQQMQ